MALELHLFDVVEHPYHPNYYLSCRVAEYIVPRFADLINQRVVVVSTEATTVTVRVVVPSRPLARRDRICRDIPWLRKFFGIAALISHSKRTRHG